MGSAPGAPGRLGQPLDPGETFTYLSALGQWLTATEQQLRALDALALASPEADSFSADLTTCMALTKAVHDRYDLLTVTFDSGRVGPAEAERLSALVWGRLDLAPGSPASGLGSATAGALGLTLPEACRLLDAMVAALRGRLSLEPSGAEVGTRLKDVRATIERIRDQVSLLAGTERSTAARDLSQLEARATDITERAKRGADVGGLLGPLELEASGRERDLIVAAGQRVETQRDGERAAALVTELGARGDAIRALVDRCVAEVDPAPTLAVPDVRSLGPVPPDADGVRAYLTRLGKVARALDAVHAAYGDALAEREEVAGLAGALIAQASATGATTPEATSLAASLTDLVTARPLPIRRARATLAAYRAYLSSYEEGRR